MHLGPGPGAAAVAESDRGRHVRVRRAPAHSCRSTSPSARNAIHGLVRWSAWTARRAGAQPGRAGAPDPSPAGVPVLRLPSGIEYALSDEGLSVATTATNVGPEPCPYGCGAHPYLTLGTATVDSVVLTAPGRAVLHSDDRGLPAGQAAVEGTEYDFTRAEADRRDAARPLLHRPRARRTVSPASSSATQATAPGSRSGWTRPTGT